MTRRKGNHGDPGGGPSPNDRTAPEWLDSKGEHGPLSVLLMVPTQREGKLPNNPFIIARSVKEQVGSIAAAYKDKDGHLVIKVRSEKKAAKLLELTELIDGTKVKVSEHARLNQAKCIVTCHSVSELTEEELVTELSSQGVIEINRLGRKGAKSATMVVTIRGTVVPKELYFGYDVCSTRAYKQAPMQCYRCFSFGHTKARCSAEEELCRNCSQAHEIRKDTDGKTVCGATANCKNCGGNHSPASRNCPKFIEEEAINEIRTNEDKSAREARRLYEERKAAAESGISYAAVAGSGNSDAKRTQDLRIELNETKQGLKRAMIELNKLKEANAQAEEAKREQEATKRALKKALAELEKLKTAANQETKRVKETAPLDDESDSDMEIVEDENLKRRRPRSSESYEDNSEDNDDNQNQTNNKPPALGNKPEKPLKAQESKPAKPLEKIIKPANKKTRKTKVGSGQKDLALHNTDDNEQL